MRRSAALAIPFLLVTLVACAPSADDPTEAVTDPAADADAGGDAPPVDDGPIPVEGDGGIGGEGGGPVTSNLILSSDAAGADQVEVAGTCLVAEDPPTYRLDLAGGGTLTVATGDEGGRLELELDGTSYRSADDQPPLVTASEGALSVQGPALADDGDQRFVDAVIGLDDLPAC